VKYKVNLPWVEDLVLRRIAPFLKTRAVSRPVSGLTVLGEIAFGTETGV
jgi:hypothetical protein